MSIDLVIGLIFALSSLLYLGYAMLRPEQF